MSEHRYVSGLRLLRTLGVCARAPAPPGRWLVCRCCDSLTLWWPATRVRVSYMEIYNEKVRDLLNPAMAGEELKVLALALALVGWYRLALGWRCLVWTFDCAASAGA